METEHGDRRATQRRRRFFMCWFDGGHRDVEGFIQNVSDDGLFVRTSEPPAIGHKLTLVIQGPRRLTCEAYGEVQWTRLAAAVPETAPACEAEPDGADPVPLAALGERDTIGFGFRVENRAALAEFIAQCDAIVAASAPAS
jgi:hypothetical protein